MERPVSGQTVAIAVATETSIRHHRSPNGRLLALMTMRACPRLVAHASGVAHSGSSGRLLGAPCRTRNRVSNLMPAMDESVAKVVTRAGPNPARPAGRANSLGSQQVDSSPMRHSTCAPSASSPREGPQERPVRPPPRPGGGRHGSPGSGPHFVAISLTVWWRGVV
jgi:hypothetical protein